MADTKPTTFDFSKVAPVAAPIPSETRVSKYETTAFTAPLTSLYEAYKAADTDEKRAELTALQWTFPTGNKSEIAVAEAAANVIRKTANSVTKDASLRIKPVNDHGKSMTYVCWFVPKINRPRSESK